MSDAVKNQLLRSDLRAFGAPTPIGNTRYFWQDACDEAANTIERLERDRDALAERYEKLREALNQIAVLAEWQTSGPDTSPRCKSDALSASAATSLRGSISEIARSALAAPKDAP